MKRSRVRRLTSRLRDDSGRHTLSQTKRRADRQHPVADLGLVRIAETDERQVPAGVDLQYCKVGFDVRADYSRHKFFARVELDGDPRGVRDDMLVRQNVACLVNDKSTADGIHRPLRHLAAKEIQNVVRVARCGRSLGDRLRHFALGVDIDDGRLDLFYDLRKRFRLSFGLGQGGATGHADRHDENCRRECKAFVRMRPDTKG